jgi:hypothetical protein
MDGQMDGWMMGLIKALKQEGHWCALAQQLQGSALVAAAQHLEEANAS